MSSASLPTPLELGKPAGLRLDGLAVTHGNPSEVFNLSIRLGSLKSLLPKEKRRAYKDEFKSLYLLSVVRTVVRFDETQDLLSPHFLPIWQALYEGPNDPIVCRLIREQPDVSLAVHFRLSAWLEQGIDNITQDTMEKHGLRVSDDFKRTGVFSGMVDLTNFDQDILNHLPVSCALPPLLPMFRDAIRVLLRRFSEDPKLRDHWTGEYFGSLDVCLAGLRHIAERDRDIWPAALRGDRETDGLVWWNCQIKIAHPEKVAESCVAFQGGEEMMACGRCRAVRYCCKSHQRADWKRHKRVCFKPSW